MILYVISAHEGIENNSSIEYKNINQARFDTVDI